MKVQWAEPSLRFTTHSKALALVVIRAYRSLTRAAKVMKAGLVQCASD
jgi:hypothetical protein